MANNTNIDFRDYIKAALAERYTIENESGKKSRLTGAELLVMRLFNAAAKGDWTAWKLVYEISGQKAATETAADIDPDIVTEVERIVNENERKYEVKL